MPSSLAYPTMLAHFIGEWEIVGILALMLILLAVDRLTKFARGLRRGVSLFLRALDHESHEAGKSVGGILGKPAAQALAPDNQTAELYDPAVFHREERTDHSMKRFHRWRRSWRSVLKRLRAKQ